MAPNKQPITPVSPSISSICSLPEAMPPLMMTPPEPEDPQLRTNDDAAAVVTAIHVIATEKAALANLECIYQTDRLAQENMARAVNQIVRTIKQGGKLVVCGVGKSGKIGRKLEATMNSMGIYSTFLHPTEALHGDLGMIRPNDTLLLISFSGKTPELLLLLPHIPSTVPVIAMTSHMDPSICPLLSFQRPEMGILLPAPIHEDEESSFGVCAPTSSTTVALALGDALAIATARKLHPLPGKGPAEVFKSFHPGGAIGAALSPPTPISMPTSAPSSSPTSVPSDYLLAKSLEQEPIAGITSSDNKCRPLVSDIAVALSSIPTVSSVSDVRILDILLTAIQNPTAKSWVKLSPTEIIPPSRVRSLSVRSSVDMNVSDVSEPLAVEQKDWLFVSAASMLDDVRQSVSDARREGSNISVVGLLNAENDVVAVFEPEQVFNDSN
ncbi:hypothetical protein DTO271G3_2275 [Paecilomyces variotii]|nr:hypothetical protein DTO271G3_2275 [Paecilomyces variotii]